MRASVTWTLHTTPDGAADACAREAALDVRSDGQTVDAWRPCPHAGCDGHRGEPGVPMPCGECAYPAGWTTATVEPIACPHHPDGARWAVEVVRREDVPSHEGALPAEWLPVALPWRG